MPPIPALNAAPSLRRARFELILAAVLWSTSSLFMRLLSEPSALALNDPVLSPLQIAFFRALIAGSLLMLVVPWRSVRFHPRMTLMVGCFASMTALYLSALGLGSAANAILLQNTAPVWVCLVAAFVLREPTDLRTWLTVLVAMIGGTIIVVGNWPRGLAPADADAQQMILLMAAGSGVLYAGVILFLRSLRHESAAWLTMLNLLGSAVCLAAYIAIRFGFAALIEWIMAPTIGQFLLLAAFGTFQMALPYILFARGLRTVGPQEAGIITLLEPLLNPVWAYLIAPDREVPTFWTWIGGAVLLAALVYRYYPPPRTRPG